MSLVTDLFKSDKPRRLGAIADEGKTLAEQVGATTAGVAATAPTINPAVPVPSVSAPATMPTPGISAASIAAANSAAGTIASRAGRASTFLTRRQPRKAATPTPTLAAGSDYTAKTLG